MAGTLPNILTILRILMVPIIMWLLLSGHAIAAFWLFITAGFTDALDGYIAKRFGAITELGTRLDPLADKMLLVAAYTALGYIGQIDWWLVCLIVIRDILILGGVALSYILSLAIRIEPIFTSKLNTVIQVILAGAVLADTGFGLVPVIVIAVLVYATALTTILSGILYLVRWVSGFEAPAMAAPTAAAGAATAAATTAAATTAVTATATATAIPTAKISVEEDQP